MKTLPRFAVLVLASLTLAAHAHAQIPFMQSDFQVSEGTTGYQFNYGVSIDRAGRFVVTWTDDGSSSSYDCFGRLYDAAGAAEGSEFEIDPSDAHQYYGYRGQGPVGEVHRRLAGGRDGRPRAAVPGRWDARGRELPRQHGTLPVFDVRVASDPSGNFVVVWTREGAGDTDVVARRFNSSDAPASNEFVVNAHTTDVQNARSVASSASGFVVVWEGYGRQAARASMPGATTRAEPR